ncbi:hypothetical protein [Pseudanabaena yagii]|uniref:Uncharacterized protein n=1 Tax=Pseudanabaena yagii GIHE-NHR1 TaxID=2722753 RepID=A0ABX1LVG2_9CYAN|nr:hypothetical protein [Pseudanabaena yagii]NMF60157.1 hypothetical protein [Pseudanabaena yagii GIHE-NHR1]
MKVDITGVLKQAQRHLAILDDLRKRHEANFPADIQSRFEVISTEMILDELIKNIEIVQNDPTQLDLFLRIYCFKKD